MARACEQPATWHYGLRAVVVDDAEEAARLVAEGHHVVLVAREGGAPSVWPEGPGRLALLVGDLADPATRAAADAMDAELFGASGRAVSRGSRRAPGSDG